MDEKILITGAKGFIGKHFVEAFPQADTLDIKDGQDICGDLPDVDYTHIIHLAAEKSVPRGEAIPKDFIMTNCWGTLNIARKYPDARIINISSSSAQEHISIYGMTKKFTEFIGSYHKNFLSVRLFNVFGEGQLPESGALIPNLIKAKVQEFAPPIFGTDPIVRDFTYIKDVVNDVSKLLRTEIVGVTDCGYARPCSVIEIAKEIFGDIFNVRFFPGRPKDVLYSCSKRPILELYGRKDGLKRTEEWLRTIL